MATAYDVVRLAQKHYDNKIYTVTDKQVHAIIAEVRKNPPACLNHPPHRTFSHAEMRTNLFAYYTKAFGSSLIALYDAEVAEEKKSPLPSGKVDASTQTDVDTGVIWTSGYSVQGVHYPRVRCDPAAGWGAGRTMLI